MTHELATDRIQTIPKQIKLELQVSSCPKKLLDQLYNIGKRKHSV